MAQSADKAALRRKFNAARVAVPAAERARAADALARRLCNSHFFRRARTVALYFAVNAEMSVATVLQRARRQRKRIFVPVLTAADTMRFAELTPDTPLRRNCYGIPEPACEVKDLRRADTLDLVIAPLVAFTRDGRRLGMGGGYYDRALRRLTRARIWRKPKFVGAAFECQRCDDLPADPWDVGLWKVCTEARLHHCSAVSSPRGETL